jgi:hypothetical protein
MIISSATTGDTFRTPLRRNLDGQCARGCMGPWLAQFISNSQRRV